MSRCPHHAVAPLVRSIADACAAQQISQAELARRTGMSPVSICRIMRGATCPSMRSIVAMTDALGLRLTACGKKIFAPR